MLRFLTVSYKNFKVTGLQSNLEAESKQPNSPLGERQMMMMKMMMMMMMVVVVVVVMMMNLSRGSMGCRGQGRLEVEILKPNTLHGEWTNDDDDDRNAAVSLLQLIKACSKLLFL